MNVKEILSYYKYSPMDKGRYRLRFNINKSEAYLEDSKPITTVTYGKDFMDKHLNEKETVDL